MNKKLLKSIACVASGVAIATSIPFTATSCGSNNEPAEQVQIEYNGSEDSKTLNEIAFNTEGKPTTTSSSGTFSIIPEKPSSFSWSFNVYRWSIDQGKVIYVDYTNWNTYLDIEINNDNKLQVKSIKYDPIPIKIDVFGKTKSGFKTNTITGFNLIIHC